MVRNIEGRSRRVRSGFGAFMLYFATLISTSTGNVFAGLYYPIAIAAMTLLVGTLLLPETKGGVRYHRLDLA